MLLVNFARSQNHWLGVRLMGAQSNRDGIGARVTVRGQSRSWVDEVRSGSSYNSSNDLRLHFGLGEESRVEAIKVRWPAGREELFPGMRTDQFVTLKEGTGRPVP
jgi:enediyne biosynthesis protein E4